MHSGTATSEPLVINSLNRLYTLQGAVLKLRSQVSFISNPTKAWRKHKELREKNTWSFRASAEQLISQNIETYTYSILLQLQFEVTLAL